MTSVADSSAAGAAPDGAVGGSWTGIEQVPTQPAGRSPQTGRGISDVSGISDVGGIGGIGSRRLRCLRRHQHPILGPFDLGGTVFQRRAREAVLGSAVVVVPAVAIGLVVSNLMFERFAEFDDLVVLVPELVGGIDAATGVETLLAFITIAANALAVALAGGYLMELVLRHDAGVSISIGTVWRSMWRRIPALTVAWLIGHAWVLLASVVVVRTKLGDWLGFAVIAGPLVLWLLTMTVLVSPVIVAERIGPFAGLRRAFRLGRRRPGVMFGFVVLCALVGGGLRLSIGAIPTLLEQSGLFTFGRFAGLAEGIAAQVSQLVIVPLVGLATAQLYLQLRMDVEGLDLVVECDTAFP